MRARPLLALPLVLPLLMAGCATADWTQPHEVSAIGTLGPGFLPTSTPSPEATIDPQPGSWDDVHPSPRYRVVLLSAGDEAEVRTLKTAVEGWARDEDVDLREVTVDKNPIDAIVAAMDLRPDLIVSAGNDLVDPLAAVTPSHLDRQFLVLGAELAEPTENVTAVDWTGAAFRGEGLGAASAYDPASFTPKRCASAVRAGVAAVLSGHTGIVIWVR